MRELKEWQARILLVVLVVACLFIRFTDFFYFANSKVIEPYGDGHKAYTTILYHAKYDSTYSHFQGMNYPYGEHVVPAATQPLLSNSIKFISNSIYDITPYTIAIVNFSLLLGILLSVFFLYLIFRTLELPQWYSIAVALGMSFLAPQFMRLTGHYGLAHMETLPILLYVMMRFDVRRSVGRSLWVALVLFLIPQIHFYFFAIMVFAVSFYFLFDFTNKWKWNKLHKYAFHYGLQVGLPLLFFFFWMYYGDEVTDRTAEPWGFFYYNAIWEGLVTNIDQPYFKWIDEHIIKIQETDMEGRAYVGLIGLIVFLILMVQWLKNKFQKPYLLLESKYTPFLNRMFYASSVILLFAMGLPFVIPGLEFLLDYTGPIRQFRSIGRFAWVFYYVMNIIAFFWIYRKVEQLQSKIGKIVLFSLVIGLFYFEAYNYSWSFNIGLDEVKEMNEGHRFTDGIQIEYDNYQAILTVPHYNIGSDNFWWHLGGYIAQKSLTLSHQTGLPVTSAMLTRTSLSHTYNQLQLVTEPYRLPSILERYPSDKPLLMAWDENTFQNEKERYQHLMEGTYLKYEKGPLRLYELPLNSFQERINSRRAKWIREIGLADTLYTIAGLKSPLDYQNFVYESFDDSTATAIYLGAGAFEGAMTAENIIFDGPIPNQKKERTYKFSFWMYMRSDLHPRSRMQLIEYDPKTGAELQQFKTDMRYLIKVFDSNGWTLQEKELRAKSADSHFKIIIFNERLKNQPLLVDELLIQPRDRYLFQMNDTMVWKNNRWFPLN